MGSKKTFNHVLMSVTILGFARSTLHNVSSLNACVDSDNAGQCHNVLSMQEYSSSISSNASDANQNNRTKENFSVGATEENCGLYLAPSTIPNAGVGIFSLKPFQAGDFVGFGDISIPIVDFGFLRDQDNFNPFASYVWDYEDSGLQNEVGKKHAEGLAAFCPGLDAAINMNSALINTERASQTFDISGLHRNHHPGAGAISPYHSGATYASEYIPSGGELFKSYGHGWFSSRGLDSVPEPYEYDNAGKILLAFGQLDLSKSFKNALWNLVRDWPMWTLGAKNAFPATLEDAETASRNGIRSLHQPSATRSLEYLQHNGRCIDNIYSDTSTIEGAGRGAFASRDLPQGVTITGSGLIWLPNRDLIEMYNEQDEHTGTQIIQNYCWGHHQSTLLLCPYGSGIGYMNHNSTLANVAIQWASNGMLNHNNKAFERDVASMVDDDSVNLAFDFVATRDISQGEELFLDYGDEWENAWNTHVRNWKPPVGAEEHVSASDMNEQLKDRMLLTKLEQKNDPYPSNLMLLCHSDVLYYAQNLDEEWMDWSEEWEFEEPGIECDILYRTQDPHDQTYWIQLDALREDGKPARLVDVPRAAFKFFDRPYTTDHHLRGAFRHEMMIPDDMFPERWKNLL